MSIKYKKTCFLKKSKFFLYKATVVFVHIIAFNKEAKQTYFSIRIPFYFVLLT